MRLVIQRVLKASVKINNIQYSSIENGLLCFVAFCDDDNDVDFEWAINKLLNLKIFNIQKSVKDLNLELLIVSQFTLFGNIKKGNKPSWSRASNPILARKLYNQFINMAKSKKIVQIKTGVFGKDMTVKLVNDGPFTLIIDTKKRS
tara:strand:+ start:10730 stop:11167 length:438 start_codon:yes stop_codon:yes gene_type:complete